MGGVRAFHPPQATRSLFSPPLSNCASLERHRSVDRIRGYRMDRLHQITTFVRVAERGGFAAAARDLQLAPSVVTTQIQALEQRLGVRLFNRNTRSVKPTEVGEAYYERCLDLLR